MLVIGYRNNTIFLPVVVVVVIFQDDDDDDPICKVMCGDRSKVYGEQFFILFTNKRKREREKQFFDFLAN